MKRPEMKEKLTAYSDVLMTVSNSLFHLEGKLELSFKIGEQEFEHKFLYAPQTPWEMLLGIDFLEKTEIVADFANKIIHVPRKIPVTIKDGDTIPHDAQKVVRVSVLTPYPCDLTGVVEPSEYLLDLGLISAHTLTTITPASRTFGVNVANFGPHEVTMPPQMIIGYLELDACSEIISQHDEKKNNQRPEVNAVQEIPAKSPVCFKDLFDLEDSVFTPDERRDFLNFLEKNQDVFHLPGQPLGCTDVLKHDIKLEGDEPPFKCMPYRTGPQQREEIRKQVQEMLTEGIIRHSNSPYSSPVVLVSKPDGSFRFCVDFRKLNSRTVKDSYPLPRTDDILDSLGASKPRYFSSLDLQSGFWQTELTERAKPLTSFSTYDGFYEFIKMPFGLSNAPATFSRMMSRVLEGLNWEYCVLFIDDILVSSRSYDEHLTRLQAVFDRLKGANLKLKIRKCIFGKRKISFLGHVVSPEGIAPDPHKCSAVMDFPRPQRIKHVRAYLGLTGYYRKHCPNYALIARPLYRLLKKDQPFVWTDECQAAFDKLKDILTNPPILGYPDHKMPFIVQADASNNAIGCILSQEQDGHERVIQYAGRNLNDAENNYTTTEKEGLALIHAISAFECYLRGNNFRLVTDHAPLTHILKNSRLNGRIARWALYLQQFQYTVVHKAGKTHSNVDGLSRRKYDSNDTSTALPDFDEDIFPPVTHKVNAARTLPMNPKLKPKDDTLVLTARTNNPVVHRPVPDVNWDWKITPQDMRQRQEKESWAKEIIHALESDDTSVSPMQDYLLCDGVLHHLYVPPNCNPDDPRIRLQLVIPSDLRHDVFMSVHGDLTAGHYDVARTYATLRQSYYWKGMHKDCQQWIRSCPRCAEKKPPGPGHKAPLQPLPLANINERWAMDFVGPLPVSLSGNSYILVMTEYATRWAEAFALSNMSAPTVARILIDKIALRFSPPQYLLSDRGANFLSQVVAEACRLIGTSRLNTSAYHPMTDGLVEKLNGTLVKSLSMFVDTKGQDWDEYLQPIVYAYNTSICVNSTHFSPYYLQYGRAPRDFLSTSLPVATDGRNQDVNEQIAEVVTRLSIAHDQAQQNLEKHRTKMKEYYDRDSRDPKYDVASLVWIYFPCVSNKVSKKLYRAYSGPFLIVKKLSPVTFRVVRAYDYHKPKHDVIHANRMKPYIHREIRPALNSAPVDNEIEEMVDVTDLHEDDQDLPAVEAEELDNGEGKDESDNDGDGESQNDSGNLQQNELIQNSETTNVHKDTVSNDISVDIDRDETNNQGKLAKNEVNRKSKRIVRPPQHLKDYVTGKAVDIVTEPEPGDPGREYELNKIYRGRYVNGKLQYLVSWKGLPMSVRTYVAEEDLNKDAIEWLKAHKVPISGK